MSDKNEIVLYQPDEAIKLEVRLEGETVWLNRNQLAILFGRDVKTIGKHIKNALEEELIGFPVVAKFATTASDFFDGQMLEPFAFVNNLIRSARTRIVLIDNYIDDSVFLRLAERASDVYYIGASIKDLGKKWFAFCKMQLQADDILRKLAS